MVIAYIDNAGQRDLREGMDAQVWPEDEKRDEIGYVRGKVVRIDRYPVEASQVRQILKSGDMANRLLESGEMMYQVQIELLPSPDDPSLYDWSFGQPEDVAWRLSLTAQAPMMSWQWMNSVWKAKPCVSPCKAARR